MGAARASAAMHVLVQYNVMYVDSEPLLITRFSAHPSQYITKKLGLPEMNPKKLRSACCRRKKSQVGLI